MRYLALAVALAACRHSPAEHRDCAAEAADVASYLRTSDYGGALYQIPPQLAPPVRDDLTDRGDIVPSVTITADAIHYLDDVITDRDSLVVALQRAHAMHADAPPPLTLAIIADARAPMASLTTVVDAAEASGFGTAMFVFRPSRAPAPPHEPAAGSVDGPSLEAACTPMKKLLVDSMHIDGNHAKADYIFPRLEAALVECRCAADPYAVRTMMRNLFENHDPIRVLRIKLDRNAPPIHASTWGEASKQLTSATTTVWFN